MPWTPLHSHAHDHPHDHGHHHDEHTPPHTHEPARHALLANPAIPTIRLGRSHDHGYPEDHGHHHGEAAAHHHHPYPHADHPLGPVTLPKVPGRLARKEQQR